MLADFCVRLAFGLLASLLLLWAFPLHPRFCRAHFLTALGLLVGAMVVLFGEAVWAVWWLLFGGAAVCVLASTAWMLEGAPGGKAAMVIGTLISGAALVALSLTKPVARHVALGDDLSSAALLGAAVTAMLLGHSYLITPSLSIKPLQRMLIALGACLACRMILSIIGLWLWTSEANQHNLKTEDMLWLSTRWIIGLLIPVGLGWMAWETTRIRSTQSATGILYVVVICCFVGELTARVLFERTAVLL